MAVPLERLGSGQDGQDVGDEREQTRRTVRVMLRDQPYRSGAYPPGVVVRSM